MGVVPRREETSSAREELSRSAWTGELVWKRWGGSCDHLSPVKEERLAKKDLRWERTWGGSCALTLAPGLVCREVVVIVCRIAFRLLVREREASDMRTKKGGGGGRST